MNRGVSFEIPNEYGKYLAEILKPIEITASNWYIGGEESYIVGDGTLNIPLFDGEIFGMEGSSLKDIIENNEYYLIFANLKAFPKETEVFDIPSYEEFLNSSCQLVLLVIDSSYITVYCKDQDQLEGIFINANSLGFDKVNYITDENDFRTKLSVW
ncbi:DUF2691 domain-containing protein [Paenibacillus lupini]|uniref:DUF2691 family protein n=1 Tax=Paenibacillus lupini TaxID=1450204 RepID=UPI00141E4048|nr:DUF2691 family protein [Paenibacillus lupini]NIK24668.1 hypothetical protein [Paenibacillus lupini]